MFKKEFAGMAIVIWVMTLNPLLAQSNNNSNASSLNPLDQIAHQLEEFTKNKSLDQLRAALGMLKSQLNVDRKRQTRLWFDVLAAIDRNLDSGFSETNSTFSRNLIPPPDAGVQYPSGVDPSAIKNIAVRADYEAALKANREKAESYNFQLQLHRLEKQATLDAVDYLKSSFTFSEADQKEFGQVIEESKLSGDRKKQMMKLLGSK